MTSISDMDLPDAVVKKVAKAIGEEYWVRDETVRAAIRAALQALLDCGRMTQLTEEERTALHRRGLKWPKNIWLIRLDADERERALQEKRK